jgi:hypothetical protein
LSGAFAFFEDVPTRSHVPNRELRCERSVELARALVDIELVSGRGRVLDAMMEDVVLIA